MRTSVSGCRRVLGWAAAAVAALSLSQSAHADLPALTTSGNRIQQNGANYILAGVGISGAPGLANEAYPGQYSYWFDYTAYSPQNYANALNNAKNVIDLVTNRSPRYGRSYGWGTRVVRFGWSPQWFDPNGDGTSFDWYKLSAYIDNVVAPLCAYAQQKGVYIIIDTGYITDASTFMLQGNLPQYNQTPSNGVIWKIWDYVASSAYDNHNQHTALRGTNVIYELYNEPTTIQGDQSFWDAWSWQTYATNMQYVVNHIRYDCHVSNICLIGTPYYDSQLQNVSTQPIQGGNIGYVLHSYPGGDGYNGQTQASVETSMNNNFAATCNAYPVVATEFNWFDSSNIGGRPNTYLGTTSVFGNALKDWGGTQGHLAGWTCWTYGETTNPQYVTSASALDPDTEDYGQFTYDWLWQTTGGNMTAQPAGPAGYSYVANEYDTKYFGTPVDLAYGLGNTCFCRYAMSGNVSFINSTFGGDPVPGQFKYGYARNFIPCAPEWSSYTFSLPVEAAFGANGSYEYIEGISGTVSFTNTTFGGDPAPGVGKEGYYMPYSQCANENGTFTFNFPADVAYGANGKYIYRKGVTGTITFNNATFGDPIPGTVKAGYYRPSH